MFQVFFLILIAQYFQLFSKRLYPEIDLGCTSHFPKSDPAHS
jgi:hypothetical protein